MLASASVLGRVELGSFGVAINCILKWNNMCLPGELRYRSFSNWFLVDMFDNDAHPKWQTHELCSQFRRCPCPLSNLRIVLSVSKSENEFSALDFRVRNSQHHGTEVFCAIYVRFAIVKWNNMCYTLTSWYWPFSRERLRRVLRKKAAVILHLHAFTPADLDLQTLTPADFTPSHLLVYIFTPSHLQI